MNVSFSSSTPPTLLERLRDPGDPDAWDRFVGLYAPVVTAWVRQLRVPPDDRADVLQDVFLRLLKALPGFAYDPSLRFRGWLFRVVRSAALSARRTTRRADGEPMPDDIPADDPLPAWVEADYRAQLFAQLVRQVRPEFSDAVWLAFWRYAVEGLQPEEVAAELGLTVAAVYQAKSRVMKRLAIIHRDLGGFLD